MAGEDGYMFGREAMRKVVETVRQIKREVRELQQRALVNVTPQVGKVHVVKNGSESIPAMTEAGGVFTPGEGEVTLARIKSSGKLENTAFRRTMYNIGASPIAANAYGLSWQELLTGRFVSLSLPAGIVRFKLTEILTLGGEADALFLEWDGDSYETTATPLVVKDFTDTPGTWWGAVGYQGWAWLPPDSDDGKYEIVWMETVARYIEFTSTENMGATSTSEMEVTVNRYWNIKDPGSTVVTHDPQGLFTRARSGAKGVAIYDERRDLYEIVECQTKAGWVRVTLTNPVSSGSSAAATVNAFGGSQQDVQDPDPADAGITVYDYDGHFRRALAGADALAIYDAVDDEYLLVECESKAGWVWVTLTADMSSSATCTVGGYKGSQQDTQNPGTIVVYPITGISDALKSGDTVLAFYDNVDDKYFAAAKPYTPMWGYTQAAWVANAGDAYVSIKLVTGSPPRTSSTVSGSAFNCYLPRVNDGDPNVVASKNICFMYDNDGDAVALSDYMDVKIGSVIFMARDMTVPAGWGFMDSTANASGNGGTGIDARRRFIRTPATVAEAGALAGDGNSASGYQHNHALSCLTAFGDAGAVTSPSVVEFWAFQGSATTGDPDGVAGAISGQPGGRNFSSNSDPMYVHLPAIERLDNKSA